MKNKNQVVAIQLVIVAFVICFAHNDATKLDCSYFLEERAELEAAIDGPAYTGNKKPKSSVRCGYTTTVTTEKQRIYTPKYPKNGEQYKSYPNNAHCVWYIEVAEDSHVMFGVLGEGEDGYDYLRIHFSDGSKHYDRRELGSRFTRFVKKGTIVVEFVSDRSYRNTGYELTFKKFSHEETLRNLTNDAFKVLNKSVETIRKYSSEVVAGSIDRFYRYKYNYICKFFIPEYNIRTGGNSMYDWGSNKVALELDDSKFIVEYDKQYSVDDAFAYGSLKSHPFTTFVVVKDMKENNHSVKMRVTSTTDRSWRVKYLSKISTMSGSINCTSGGSNFLVIYDVFQVYNNDNPSVCEVFFTFQQKPAKNQTSRKVVVSNRKFAHGDDVTHLASSLSASGNNFVMGYTLLSKYNPRSELGLKVSQQKIEEALTILVEGFNNPDAARLRHEAWKRNN